LLLEYTIEELMIEWLEDLIDEDPTEAYPQNAEATVIKTGDATVDKWQTKAIKGEEIDFEAEMDEEGKRMLAKLRTKAGKTPEPEEALEIDADYTKG
jgi:hypothetical protein